MKTVIIVQARMTSTRLPGKVLKPVMGKPLLVYQLERLRCVKHADEIVVAITTNKADDAIAELCKDMNVNCFRGSEQDVLSRYYFAATEHKADAVVRITSDCPLIDPRVIDQVITVYKEHHPDLVYVSNVGERTFPRGMDTEVFSYTALAEAQQEAMLQSEREHVTPFIRNHAERYRSANLRFREDQSKYRWTVDTPEDFALIEKMICALYNELPEFSLEDCLRLLAKNPQWATINENIRQKEG